MAPTTRLGNEREIVENRRRTNKVNCYTDNKKIMVQENTECDIEA